MLLSQDLSGNVVGLHVLFHVLVNAESGIRQLVVASAVVYVEATCFLLVYTGLFGIFPFEKELKLLMNPLI